MSEEIAILGAGITGLTLAWHLDKAGVDFTVYEASERAGGMLESFRENGFLAEHGPHTILASRPEVDDLVDELGLSEERIWANEDSKKRFTVRDGEVSALPMSPQSFLDTPVYSTGAKLRLLAEPWIGRRDDEVDESVTAFVTRRMGEEFLDYGVDLLVNGIWAGDPNRLSARHAFKKLYALEREHGSVIRGAIARARSGTGGVPRMFAFKDGNATLTDAMSHALAHRIKFGREVVGLSRADGSWKVRSRSDGTREKSKKYAQVISTLPLWRLGTVLDEEPSFSSIDYPPVGVVTFAFRREDVVHPLDGFGLLVPEDEPFEVLGMMFTSTLFDHRVPNRDFCTIAVFMGGARHRDHVESWTAERRREVALADLRRLLHVDGEPVWEHQAMWHRGIPQYEVGYSRQLAEMQAFEDAHAGLVLAGNYRHGVAVPDIIAEAKRLAHRIIETRARQGAA